MSNEEKILSLLTKMQGDIERLKVQPENQQTISDLQWTILEAMRNSITDEEKDALGKYQAAEEARKAVLYG
ncbi:MAG: hypothetical protein IKT98_06995 [Selenomonadaceae bacterium]|nr:hypothetical protein [Selenomonadaceae bacterium]